jgi:hypothetical protein
MHGTLTYGYTGIAIPNELTRRGKPRRRWEIDAETAKWVLKIFDWFVHQRRGFTSIARELRKKGAPTPPKVARWTRGAVRYLLANRRYIGDWSYGWKETIWQSKADYGRQFLKDKPTQEHREEALRLIDDVLFCKAQERIAKKLGRGGRPCHKGERVPDAIVEVLWCPEHERHLSPHSGKGDLLACPECKAQEEAEQFLYSLVNRHVARRLVYKKLAEAVHADAEMIQMVIAAACRHAEGLQSADPQLLAALEKELQSLTSRIAFVLDNPGETDTDQAENAKQLAKLRAERATVERQLAEAKTAATKRRDTPTAEQIEALIAEMADILNRAATSENEDEAGEVMRIVMELTGGQIVLSQQGERRRKRGWLRGTFHIKLLDTLLSRYGSAPTGEKGKEVVIDFHEPLESAAVAGEAMKLLESGEMLMAEVGKQLGVSKSRLTLLVKRWHEARGLPAPDGRIRRSTLKKKTLSPSIFQSAAEQVMALYNQDLLLGEIAEQLDLDHNTVTAAVRYWHEQRNLPVPDGRTRRKQLERKSRDKKPNTTLASQEPTGIPPSSN